MENTLGTGVERKVCGRTVGQAELDQALADSFPSSDPIQWTLGLDPHCDTEDVQKVAADEVGGRKMSEKASASPVVNEPNISAPETRPSPRQVSRNRVIISC